MQSNAQFWEQQGEAWKPLEAKEGYKKPKAKKEVKVAEPSDDIEEGVNENAPLVRKGNWRNHYVNGHGFTVGIATFTVCVIGCVILGAAMVVSGTAMEVQELAPAPKEYQTAAYGEKHAGVGFANYVVGNAVQSFWNKEMGKKGPATKAKMSDPFASFLLKPKKGAKDDKAAGGSSDETAEEEADNAQPVDQEHGKIGGANATPEAIKHVKDVALTHKGKRGRSTDRSSK